MRSSLLVLLFLFALHSVLVLEAKAQEVFNPVAQGRRGLTATGSFQYGSGTTDNIFSTSGYQSDESQLLGGTLRLGLVKFISEGKRLDFGLSINSTFNRFSSTFIPLIPPSPASSNTFLQNSSTFGPYVSLIKYTKIFDLNRWYFTYGALFGLGFSTTNSSSGSSSSINTNKANSWSISSNATALLGLAFFPSERIGLDAFVNLVTLSYLYRSTSTKLEGSTLPELPEAKTSIFNANLLSGFSSGAVSVSFTYYLK